MSYGTIYLNGVNYSGSHVEPNTEVPSGATVIPLSNVKIDDDYFSISGGGGGSTIKTYEKTITTNQYGWWIVEDENGNELDPSNNTVLSIQVKYDGYTETPLGCMFSINTNTDGSNTPRYSMTLENINSGGFIRASSTVTVRVVYI